MDSGNEYQQASRYMKRRNAIIVAAAAAIEEVAVTMLFTHTRYLYIHIYTGHSSALSLSSRSFVLRSLSIRTKKKLRRKGERERKEYD
jgi:hypothetical protein